MIKKQKQTIRGIDLDELDEIKRKTIENDSYGLHEAFANDVRIGYIAQELEKLIPEVVESDSKGYLSLNYTDLIPLAFEAIKEQQEQIDLLKKELENTKILNEFLNLPEDLGIVATLFPNDPNPFDAETTVKYNIESEFDKAELIIFDFWGDILVRHAINEVGEGKYLLRAGVLSNGKYNYSLIINGVVVDTRTMILMK